MLLLVINIFCITVDSAETGAGAAPATGTTATPAAGAVGTTKEETITAGPKEEKEIGDKIGLKEAKAATIKDATLTTGKDGAKVSLNTPNGEFKEGDKTDIKNVEGNKGLLGIFPTKPSVKLKDGKVDTIDAKAAKDGADLKVEGKNGESLKFNAPEGAKIIKNSGDPKIKVSATKDGKITSEPVITRKDPKDKKKKDDDETVEYNSQKFWTQLPDSVAQSWGLLGSDGKPMKVEFQGVLSSNGDNWMVPKGMESKFRINGVEGFNAIDLTGKISNSNTGINIFPEKGFDMTSFKENGGGSALVVGEKGFRLLTTNSMSSGAVDVLKGNPWGVNIGENGHLAVQALGNKEGNGNIIVTGNKIALNAGTVQTDYSSYSLVPEKGELIYNKKPVIAGFGEELKGTKNVPLSVDMFKADGTPFSKVNNKLNIIEGDIDTNSKMNGFKIVEMNKGEVDIGRVALNQPGFDSKTLSSIPIDSPINPVNPPGQPVESPGEKPKPDAGGSFKAPQALIRNDLVKSDPKYKEMFGSLGAQYDPAKHKYAALVFSQLDCAPCKAYAPTLAQLAQQRGDVKVIPIDAKGNGGLMNQYAKPGQGTPYTVIIDTQTGKPVRTFSGPVSGSQLNAVMPAKK